jgi:RAMP superfamily
MAEFFNPYAFVPALRDRESAGRGRAPRRLGVLGADRWSGSLRVRVTAVSPLLVTEQERSADGSVSRRTRQVAGRVSLAPASLKGMVRSEFEAVTGSRFGMFEEHDRRLGYRARTRDSADLVPARVVDDKGVKRVLLLRGMQGGVAPRRRLLKAAWVPRYGARALTLPPGVVHGAMV